MRLSISILLLISSIHSTAQKFDGFVITEQDSLFKGYMKISIDGYQRNILMTKNKKLPPRQFKTAELKYYAYKKDTFAILKNFYAFEEKSDYIEMVEAKVLISKGKLKLYSGIVPDFDKSNWSPGVIMGPNGQMMMGGRVSKYHRTYIVKDEEGTLRVIKSGRDFFQSIEPLISNNVNLVELVRQRKLRFKDTEKIIQLYNQSP
jgi:hypothetical protein